MHGLVCQSLYSNLPELTYIEWKLAGGWNRKNLFCMMNNLLVIYV
jgi:hypothetical protein